MTKLTGYSVGDRVKLHPACDWWMRGAQYGTVRKVGTKWYHVELEVMARDIGKVVAIHPDNIVDLAPKG